MKKLIITLLFFLFSTSEASIIYTSVSTDSITVGDKIYYDVSLVVPPDAEVTPPEPDTSLEPLIIKDMYTEREKREKADSLSFNYVITSYSVSRCSIPSMPFIVTDGEDIDTLFSDKRVIGVFSVIDSDSAQIRDVKGPVEAGRPPLWWLWLTAVLAAGALLFFLVRHLMKRGRTVSAPPPMPPYEEALEALEELRKKDYLSKGEIRLYAFDLSFILKRYISRRFGDNVMDYTASDMTRWIKGSGFEKGRKNGLSWFFKTSDPIKFARVVPDRDTLKRLYDEVWDFIRETKPEPREDQKQKEDKGEESEA